MILPSANQFWREAVNLPKMDFTQQQQALLLYLQQQAILTEYLQLLQILDRPSNSLQSATFSTLLPSLFGVQRAPEFLASFIQQQRATALSQNSFQSKFGAVEGKDNALDESNRQAFIAPFQLQQSFMTPTEKGEGNEILPKNIIEDNSEIRFSKSPNWEWDNYMSPPGTSQFISRIQLSTPETTPSPSASSSSISSEGEHVTAKDKNGDDEVVYVDVESVEDKNYAKGQRKAHIEFYRKLKALRQREKILECQLCHDKIENQEHSVRAHVHSHSDTALYRCKLCGAESKEQSAMFAHTKRCHPTKANVAFEDRRDMNSLSDILLKCFPRISPKARVGYNEIVDRIWKNVETNSLTTVTCALCLNSVQLQKSSISRHAHSHPHYRCKRCKLICVEEEEILRHFKTVHKDIEPKIHKDYNACAAADVMVSVLKKCFPSLIG